LDSAQAAVSNAQSVVLRATAGIQAGNSAVAAAQADVVKAQAAVDDAKAKADRRVAMAAAGADSKEDVETAQTTWKPAVAGFNAFVAQQNALKDSVKVAQDRLKVAKSVLTSNQDQAKQFGSGNALGAGRRYRDCGRVDGFVADLAFHASIPFQALRYE